MSVRNGTTLRFSARRRVLAVAGLVTLAVAVTGCNNNSSSDSAAGGGQSAKSSPSAKPTPAASVTSNLPPGSATVAVDQLVRLQAKDGTFKDVSVTIGGSSRTLRGTLSADKTAWTSKARLEPGTKYSVHAVAQDSHGLDTTSDSAFSTDNLTLDQQTYPSIAPLENQTVGVGMPVIVHFDVPVTDKKAIERHLHVTSNPVQQGSWHWISDNEVHWRPAHYWKAGTDVTVHADVNSIPAGNGIYGQLSRTTTFHIGDSVIDKVNIKTHRMGVWVNGKLARSIPISAGKPGFITRSGVKVIIEKDRHKRMDASTIGIAKNSPNYYNLSNVEYAMRVTYSGEFLHAAPWSVGYQGSANVSHGCVGMSTANAAWLYNLRKVGDVVEVHGSNRHMTLTNGWGDWNESFAQYQQGSALN
jgi:lipoprotein-anchoring transpeptidase ErfK/SrfK